MEQTYKKGLIPLNKEEKKDIKDENNPYIYS